MTGELGSSSVGDGFPESQPAARHRFCSFARSRLTSHARRFFKSQPEDSIMTKPKTTNTDTTRRHLLTIAAGGAVAAAIPADARAYPGPADPIFAAVEK